MDVLGHQVPRLSSESHANNRKPARTKRPGAGHRQRGHLVALCLFERAPHRTRWRCCRRRFCGICGRCRAAVAPQSSGPTTSAKSIGWPLRIAAGAVIEDFAFMGWREPATVEYDVTKLENHSALRVLRPQRHDETGLDQCVGRLVCRVSSRNERHQSQGHSRRFGSQRFGDGRDAVRRQRHESARPSDLKLWGSLPDNSIDFPLLLDPGFKLGVFFTSTLRRSTCSWIPRPCA